ncbi:hypothetical protein DSO57_1017000 [Entomophthora muscae]|uniref:Uncharacterized protein n=1 Tax=Entomophthora muscae TaxID=34485 RepID=A0ACC2RJE0_9FUNG|nr:hypothetical protein DSO57_1017000 [Entomophthora muscae]
MAVDNREDCYYFLNGGCNKANSCQFRHSEEAKNTINVCTEWMETKMCKSEGCNLRHSTYHIATPLPVQKDARSEVACYWEANGGCKKYHCPYKHNAPNKTPGFPTFRPPTIPNAGPMQFTPAAQMFSPRPPLYSSHNKTLILNNSAPVQPSTNTSTEAFTPKPIIANNTAAPPVRPPQSNIPAGIQIKNISNGNGKSAPVGVDSPKTQFSFKSSKVAPDVRPQQKSVFERISNFNPSPDALLPKDISTRKALKTSPKPHSEANDSFGDIKIKTLDEILKEKRRKQGQDSSALPETQPISEVPAHLSAAPEKQAQLSNISGGNPNEVPTSVATKRNASPILPASKKLREDLLHDELDDFGLEFDDLEFNEADSNILEMELDADFPEL